MLVYSHEEKHQESAKQLWRAQNWQSPLYEQKALKFYAQIASDKKMKVQDKSFALIWENEPVILFQGAIIENDGIKDLTAHQEACISVANNLKLTTKTGKTFLKEFDKIAEEVSGCIRYRDFLIDGQLSFLSKHLLIRGAKTNPVFWQVIDLNHDEVELKRAIRKSYSSLINWGQRELNPQVFDASTMTWDSMLEFRELHIREAGRETRSKDSWKRQLELVLAGEGFVVLGRYNDELVSAGFFMHSKTNCYYGVSASRRDLFKKPMFHALMWTAILQAKKIGCRWFEVGGQVYPNHLSENPPSQKEQGISDFKAGFGGQTRLFLDLALYSKDME